MHQSAGSPAAPHRRSWAAWSALALFQFAADASLGAQPAPNGIEQSAAIARAVAAVAPTADRTALNALYKARNNAPLWYAGGASTPQAAALVRVLRGSAEFGLRPTDYSAESLAARFDPAPSAAAAPFDASLDVALSQAALRFLNQLHGGRVDPRAAGFNLRETRTPVDAARLLPQLATGQDAAALFSAAEPQFYHYALLRKVLARYRELATDSTLTSLPATRGTTRLGSRYLGAPALRRLLTALGDLPATADAPPSAIDAVTFDTSLAEGVRSFQTRHGLDADGLLGKRTMAALTTPLPHRVRQIELTLERWRWLPTFKSPPIIVNVPQFRLFAFRTVEDRAADIEQMPVIVGKAFEGKQTPIFLGDMQYIVFRPYWDVPRDIAVRELLPKLKADANYAERNHLELVRGQGDDSPVVPATPQNVAALAAGKLRIRQRPGTDNALGLAKFIFPNDYNVYLHSTPAQQLFQESRRDFSHGCIRVADPAGLAAYVLRDTGGEWTRSNIDAAMQGTTSRRVKLARPVRVMILYGTALATEAGQVMFFDDIYGHDRKLEQLLGLQPA